MRVAVYYNLHKHCLSVTHKGRVVKHVQSIRLSNVEFKVRQGGRERVIREGRKNVHAFIVGDLTEESMPEHTRLVTYNPYKYASFVDKASEAPVYHASHVRIEGRQVYAA